MQEQSNLTTFSNIQMVADKKEEESSLAGGDGSSWHSVYKPTTVSLKYERRSGMSRYLESLKHILPVRINTGPGAYMPVDRSGCFAYTFFSWLTPLVWRTFRRGLNLKDLYTVAPEDSCSMNGARFSMIWEDVVKNKSLAKSRLLGPLLSFIRTRFLLSCLAYLTCIAFGFVGPIFFMRMLLNYIQSPVIDHIEGVQWMLILIACEFLRILCFAIMWAINIPTAIRARAAIMSLVYQKVVGLKYAVNTSVGELINLFANDCQKVFLMVYTLPLLIGGPIVVVGTVIFTWWVMGPYCFVGVGVFAISYVLQFGISYLIAHVRNRVLKFTDNRVSLMTEYINNMKLIKLYAWERPLLDIITSARCSERQNLEKFHYLQILSSSIMSLSSVIATIATILVYTLYGHDLTPAEAFTIVLVNSIASHGIGTLPMCIRNIINGVISLSRLQALLHLEDRDSYITLTTSTAQSVQFSEATLTWEQVMPTIRKVKKGEVNLTVAENEKANHQDDVSPETALVTLQSESGLPPALVDINFAISKGQLIGVCGTVGSGKSSLLAALLGQMKLVKGNVAMHGSVAFVSQQPWLMNTTLRENILFGQLFNSKRYYEAVYCCGLTEDIALLSGGDQAEISEKGCTLSGGQRQRTSLARAQYADRDLYLLDDPLSAVDGQVGTHVFQHCIKGALRGKTVILVTNQIQYLQECDQIVLMRDGRIIEQGTHRDLISQESEYAMLVDLFAKEKQIESRETTPTSNTESPTSNLCSPVQNRSFRSRSKSPSLPDSMTDVDDSGICDGQLVEDEKVILGNISWETYMTYIKSAGGFAVSALVLIWFILQAASAAFSKYWLSYWFAQSNRNSTYEGTSITSLENVEGYQLVYGLSIVIIFTFTIILGFLFTKTSLRASSSLHNEVLLKVFYSPMHFFDVTPAGRILNIFTRDTDEIDNSLPSLMESFLNKIMAVIFALLLVIVVYHWFILPLLVLLTVFVFIQRMFRSVMRDLKRMENISRSPIYSHVGITVDGLATIKAYNRQDDFSERFFQLVDKHSSPQYLFYSSLRWIGIRMDLLCLVITLVTALFVVFLKGDVYPSYAALALALAMQMSGMYQYVVRVGCDLETRFTSVERILNYTEELECESPAIVENYRPSPDWPMRGQISFMNVKMRYRPGLPLALKGLSFDIKPQEKLGIVGRTGAGKSSIGVALFRLVELQSGSIFIDSINIRDLGLEDLRSNMSIIPQDPVLFQGTIRYNLDPFEEYEDDELWIALERTHMKEKVVGMHFGLYSTVVECGHNFSVGEKQLLSMARSLLRQSKIVLLDEATSSVDNETDQLIQKTLKEVFADSTVLTIAHRLSTVKNCDRVMVLCDGKIIEIGPPKSLLDNPKSAFSLLMSTAGL